MQKDAVYERIGSRIRDIRKERGLNQEHVAHALDLTRTAVTNIETGRQGIQVHQLLLIAKALNVSAVELLDMDWTDLQNSAQRGITESLPENLASVVSKYQTRLAR